MLNDGDLWLTGIVQNQFTFFLAGFIAVTFFAALLLAYTNRRTSPCVIPLSTPRENDKIEEYIVAVYTSSWPGSRCPPSTSVYANLNGLFHESGSVLLRKQKSNRQIFTRGSVDIFVLQTKENLGNLQDIELELKNSHDHASNWKPQKFEVYNFNSREHWIADIIPSLKCQKYVKEKLKLSKTPVQIPRWKRFIKNFLGYHYWFFYLSNPESFGIFSITVRTLLTFFAETSLMFSNIMCYVVYHESSGVMILSTADILGSLLALFTSSIVILGIEYALCNIRPTFQRRYLGLPNASGSNEATERLKGLDVYWEGSDTSTSSSDSDIQISGPIAEIRRKRAVIKKKKALEEKRKEKELANNSASFRRNRRYLSRNIESVTDSKNSDKPRLPSSSFEGSRNTRVSFAPNVNKSNPRLNESCGQQVDHFKKATDTVSAELKPIEVKHLWLEGRQSSKRLPGEHMNIYTGANDVWETSSSRTSLLTIDSVQNSTYSAQATPLSICEQGQVTQKGTNLNFSSNTDNGSKFPLLDTTRKFASDIKKWWFEGRKSDKPAEGEHMHIYKTYSEDWDTTSSRSSLSEIPNVPHHVIESLRPKIDNFHLTPSNSVTFISESDTSVHLSRSMEMQGASDDQLLFNKGSRKTAKSYRSKRTADLHPRPNRRTTNEKQNNAMQSQSIDDFQIGSSLSTLALQYLKQSTPAPPTDEGDDDDGSVRFIYNTKKKSFFDVLSPSNIRSDSKKIERSFTDNADIPTAEITSLIRKKSSKRPPSSVSTDGLIQQPKSFKRLHTGFPTIHEFDQDTKPKVIALNVKPKMTGSSQNVPVSPEKFGSSASPEVTQKRLVTQGIASVADSDVASVVRQDTAFAEVTPPTCTSSTGLAVAASLDVTSVTAPEIASSTVASLVDMSRGSQVNEFVASSVNASIDAPVIVPVASPVKASPVNATVFSSIHISQTSPVMALVSSSVNASVDAPVMATVNASQVSPVIKSVVSSVNASRDIAGIVSVSSSLYTIPDSPESSVVTCESNTSLDNEDSMLEVELEKQFEEFLRCLNDDPYSDEAMDLYIATKKQMPDILETVSYCTAFKSQSEYSIDLSSASTCSSATTVLENKYRIKDRGMSSSMDMLEKVAEAVSKNMPGSSRSASSVTDSFSVRDSTSSESQRLASENSSHTTFSDPYLYRPIYPSEYRITDSDFLSKCQFSWLTSDIYTDNNFIPNLLQTILLDIDSLMTNDRAWPYLRKKTRTWCVMVCRNLWNQIHAHMLDRDFVIKQDIRLKRIQNREDEENFGSSSSEIDLHALLSVTAVSEESDRSEVRCLLINQALDCYCDCGRTECRQLQNMYSNLLSLASSILSQTVNSLYRLISQSERISQEALLDLCNAINRCMKVTANDLAAVAVEPDLITCYDDLWSLPVDPGYRVLASIIVHKSLRRGAAIYDYEWHLGKRAFFLVTEVIDSAVEDVKCEVYEDSVIAKLCQDAIKEATKEVLQEFGDPIYIFTQHAIKHKLIHITKDIVKAKHPLSFIEDAVKQLASVWRLEGLDLSVNITSKLVQALITGIFKEQLKDTRIFSNLVQLKEIEQRINRFVRTAVLCATNYLLVCIKTGEPISQAKLRGLIEQTADEFNTKVKSKEAKGAVSETAERTQRQRNNSSNVQDRRLNSQNSPDRQMPHILAEEINFNIDVASATVYYYLIDQSSILFDEYTFDLEISSMVDNIIFKARNSLIADELKKIARVEKIEKPHLYPNDKFEPSEMYLKMKSSLISYNVIMEAQMSLIEDSIGDPFTLDSKEIYELRKELGPLKMYSKFVDQGIQNRNKQEMVKELKRYSKRHRDYVTINLQNVADSHCIASTTPNYDDRDLFLLEWYLTGQLQRKLSPTFRVPLLLIIFLFTLFSLVFIALKGAELTIIQCQEWMSLYLLTSFFFAFLITPIKAWCITWFQPVKEPFLILWQ